MVDKASWHLLKNRLCAHAEITDNQSAGRRGLHSMANGLAPCIFEFLGDNRDDFTPGTLQGAMKDRPRRDPVGIAVTKRTKPGIGGNRVEPGAKLPTRARRG